MTESEYKDMTEAHTVAKAQVKTGLHVSNLEAKHILERLEKWEKWTIDNKRTVFILRGEVDKLNGLVDGDPFALIVLEKGIYQYINTGGAKATVRKYLAVSKKNWKWYSESSKQ